MEHVWVRDYDVVDHSCAYCKKCNILYAEYYNNVQVYYKMKVAIAIVSVLTGGLLLRSYLRRRKIQKEAILYEQSFDTED